MDSDFDFGMGGTTNDDGLRQVLEAVMRYHSGIIGDIVGEAAIWL